MADPPRTGIPLWKQSLREMMHSFRASPVFVLAALITLGRIVWLGRTVVLMNLAPDLLPGPIRQMGHGTDPAHRVHEIAFALLYGVAAVGLVTQLRRPLKSVAGMLMTLIPWVGLLLAGVLTPPSILVAPLALIVALLHPAGRNFFRSFSVSRVNWVMLALVGIAAVPLLTFASTNIQLQATVRDQHAAMGHYGHMAAYSFTVIVTGVLASLRPDGWRLTAWAAGLLPAVLGVVSMVFPVSGSFSLVWALAAIAWCAVFVAAAERTKNAESPALLGALLDPGDVRSKDDDARVEVAPESTARTPRWKNVVGAIALVLVLGLRTFIGGGPGGHGPGGGPGVHGPSLQTTPSSDPASQTPSSSVIEDRTAPSGAGGDTPSGDPGGHRPPRGGH